MPELVIDSFPHHLWPEGLPIFDPKSFVWGGLFIYFLFIFIFSAGFGIIFGFLGVWFPASLLLCFLLFAFPASLLVCLSASLLYLLLVFSASAFLLLCFTCFFSFLLLCFPCFSASLLFCFCALLLCFSAWCLYSLFVFSFLLLYSLLFVNTLGETQRNLKEILIRTPDKKPYMKP